MLGAVIVVGAGRAAWSPPAGSPPAGARDRPRRRRRRRRGGLRSRSRCGACAALAAGWMVPTLGTLAAGMDRADSLWYHMPLAARFVQTGYLGHIYFFDPIFLASFYPGELRGRPRGRRSCSSTATSSRPLINLGWLAVALLAGLVHRPALRPRARRR